MTSDQLLIYIGAIIFILILSWIVRLEIKIRKLCAGKNSNLDDSIDFIKKELKKLNISKDEIEKFLLDIDMRLKRSNQTIETVRFNPFAGTGFGGNQSFASCFADEKGNGVIISTLYSRERTSVFAKPIKEWKSEYELSEEEKTVLVNAKSKVSS